MGWYPGPIGLGRIVIGTPIPFEDATFTGTTTIEGDVVAGGVGPVTFTGNFVFDGSTLTDPTISGTVGGAATFTGPVTFDGLTPPTADGMTFISLAANPGTADTLYLDAAGGLSFGADPVTLNDEATATWAVGSFEDPTTLAMTTTQLAPAREVTFVKNGRVVTMEFLNPLEITSGAGVGDRFQALLTLTAPVGFEPAGTVNPSTAAPSFFSGAGVAVPVNITFVGGGAGGVIFDVQSDTTGFAPATTYTNTAGSKITLTYLTTSPV